MAPKRRTPASSGPVTSSSQGTPAISSAGSKGTKSVASNSSSKEIVEVLWARYLSETPQRILLLDGFMAYLVILGVLQFVYCVISGNYPFNAFLAGFSAAVGQFVLTASLRMQTSTQAGEKEAKKEDNGGISSERAFADYDEDTFASCDSSSTKDTDTVISTTSKQYTTKSKKLKMLFILDGNG